MLPASPHQSETNKQLVRASSKAANPTAAICRDHELCSWLPVICDISGCAVLCGTVPGFPCHAYAGQQSHNAGRKPSSLSSATFVYFVGRRPTQQPAGSGMCRGVCRRPGHLGHAHVHGDGRRRRVLQRPAHLSQQLLLSRPVAPGRQRRPGNLSTTFQSLTLFWWLCCVAKVGRRLHTVPRAETVLCDEVKAMQ